MIFILLDSFFKRSYFQIYWRHPSFSLSGAFKINNKLYSYIKPCRNRNMNLQIKLLLYFDRRHIINDMKNKCDCFLEKICEESLRKFPPVQYLLRIDVMDLLDYSPELGDFLLKEPLLWQQLCTEIFYACFRSIDNNVSQFIGISQITTKIRLTSLPRFLPSEVQTYNSIGAYTGLLVEVSKPTNYVYHTVWSCPEECDDNEVILHYIPKIPPKCYVCRSTLFENNGLRRCTDQVLATFLIKNELFCKKFTILDDLILELKLGVKYVIHAVVLKNSITVWSLEKILNLVLPMCTVISPEIEELHSKCEGVPWKFIYCLSTSIGSNIRPFNSFMNLKMNLLLSVCSIKAHMQCGSTILHVLASGFDTGFVEKLMSHAAELTDPFVELGVSNGSVATGLLAASGGVCNMTLPLHVYSQKQIHAILSAMETGEVAHETGNVKLKCAVWAHGKDFKKIILRNVSSVFRNMSRGDHGEYADDLSEFILQQAIEPVKTHEEDGQALKDVGLYLDTVAGMKVYIDMDAENLLRKYFLAARKARSNAVTSVSISALVDVCITSARLCRHPIANINDAVFSIWLHVSGASESRLAPVELLETPADITKLEKVISKFRDWLDEFTDCDIY